MSFLSSITGGDKPDQTYARKRDTSLDYLSNLRDLFRGLGNSSQGVLDITDPAYKEQLGHVTDILGADPYTDSYSAGRIADATAGTDAAYQAARARLTSDLTSRGLGDSGTMAGGLSQIEAGRAGVLSGAANDVAMQAIQDRERRAKELLGITGAARDDAFGQRSGALGAEAGIDNNLAGNYADAYGQEVQQSNARFQSFMQLLGGLGNAAGSYYGARSVKAPKPAKSTYGPGY